MGMLIGRVIATALMVSVLMSCGSVGDIRGVRDTGPSIFVTGSLERVKEAAVTALAGVRLGSPQIEPLKTATLSTRNNQQWRRWYSIAMEDLAR